MKGWKRRLFALSAVDVDTLSDELSREGISCSRADGEVKDACPETDVSTQTALLTRVSDELRATREALQTLEAYIMKAAGIASEKERATYFRDAVLPAMERLRTPVDKLEMLVDKEMWPMPSYGDMIFEV